jgi:hypothetical protein
MSRMPASLAARALSLRRGDRRCKACRMPFLESDCVPWFPRLCATCGASRTKRLISRVLKRHGRDRGLELIRMLARPEPPEVTPTIMAEVKDRVRELNSRTDQYPVCPDCEMPIQPGDEGLLWADRCMCCDHQRWMPMLYGLVARFGAFGARLKLEILTRSDP